MICCRSRARGGVCVFFFQAEDGIRDLTVTGVQTCALPISGGFARDEPFDQLGMALLLPPWFEDRRQEIIAMLEPIVVPDANRPAGAHAASRLAPPPESGPAAAGGPTASRRTSATFIGGDVPQQ